MPLFVCDQCSTIENTALGHYWLDMNELKAKAPRLCSACKGGAWHGQFPRIVATADELRARIAADSDARPAFPGGFIYLGRFQGTL